MKNPTAFREGRMAQPHIRAPYIRGWSLTLQQGNGAIAQKGSPQKTPLDWGPYDRNAERVRRMQRAELGNQ